MVISDLKYVFIVLVLFLYSQPFFISSFSPTGVCHRCKDQIEWKCKYGKYKPLTEPAKWTVAKMSRKGPPKHQNKFAWKPNAGVKINETEVGGKFRPLSDVTGVCHRCKDQIEWKRKYGKYKPLTEPAKCFLGYLVGA